MRANELEANCRELCRLQALIAEAENDAEAVKDAMGFTGTMQIGNIKQHMATKLDTAALPRPSHQNSPEENLRGCGSQTASIHEQFHDTGIPLGHYGRPALYRIR